MFPTLHMQQCETHRYAAYMGRGSDYSSACCCNYGVSARGRNGGAGCELRWQVRPFRKRESDRATERTRDKSWFERRLLVGRRARRICMSMSSKSGGEEQWQRDCQARYIQSWISFLVLSSQVCLTTKMENRNGVKYNCSSTSCIHPWQRKMRRMLLPSVLCMHWKPKQSGDLDFKRVKLSCLLPPNRQFSYIFYVQGILCNFPVTASNRPWPWHLGAKIIYHETLASLYASLPFSEVFLLPLRRKLLKRRRR